MANPPSRPPPMQVLSEAGDLIASHARRGEIEAFSQDVDRTAMAVCQLTKASARAAYLVGIAHPSNTLGQTQFARVSRVICCACVLTCTDRVSNDNPGWLLRCGR